MRTQEIEVGMSTYHDVNKRLIAALKSRKDMFHCTCHQKTQCGLEVLRKMCYDGGGLMNLLTCVRSGSVSSKTHALILQKMLDIEVKWRR